MSEEKADPHDSARQRRYAPDEFLLLYQIRRSTGWIAFFALVLSVGVAAAGYLLWQQVGVTQDQLDQMTDQSAQIQKNMDAAQQQNAASVKAIEGFTALLRQNIEAQKLAAMPGRPWVGIDSINAPALAANQTFVLRALIRNSGTSPALNVRAVLASAVPATKDVAAPDMAPCEDCLPSVILPNGVVTYNVTVGGDVLTKDKIDGIKNGADAMLLVGRIDYSDATATAHTTMVCMTYVPKAAAFSTCTQGNSLN